MNEKTKMWAGPYQFSHRISLTTNPSMSPPHEIAPFLYIYKKKKIHKCVLFLSSNIFKHTKIKEKGTNRNY